MKLTDAERHLMEHTTGWHHEQRMYRNHFVTNESTTDWPIIQGLIARGLMLMSRAPSQLSGGDPVFAVTAAGIEALKASSQPEPTPETEPAPPPDAEPEQAGFDPFCPQCGSTEPDEDLCCDVCGVDMCHLADLRRLIAAHDAKRPAAEPSAIHGGFTCAEAEKGALRLAAGFTEQRDRAESAEAELALVLKEADAVAGALLRNDFIQSIKDGLKMKLADFVMARSMRWSPSAEQATEEPA